MRIAPILIPHLKTGTTDLWDDAALCAMLTHNDTGATAACAPLVSMLWQLLAMTAPPPWWLETVPSVVYLLMRHGHDPEEAIVRAVNDTKDNDTVAAIVGAAVGALHGRAALPSRWMDHLLGRTTDNDDGQVFELLEAAREKWGKADAG